MIRVQLSASRGFDFYPNMSFLVIVFAILGSLWSPRCLVVAVILFIGVVTLPVAFGSGAPDATRAPYFRMLLHSFDFLWDSQQKPSNLFITGGRNFDSTAVFELLRR